MATQEVKKTKNVDINGYKLVEYWKSKVFENNNLDPKNIDDLISFEDRIMDGQVIKTEHYNIYYNIFEDSKELTVVIEDKTNGVFYNTAEAWTEEIIDAIKMTIKN